jgi:segregation and condensation protein A
VTEPQENPAVEAVTAPVAEAAVAPAEASAEASAPVAAPAAEPAKKEEKAMITRTITDDDPFAILVNKVYEGPLDLLLDLIRKQDIDIYDIPIAKITAQFLAYVNQLKATDVDTAGEFIYMASLLIHIKSKMLLPRMPKGPEDAVEDPRRELVERLLEHERFKNAAQMLQEKQMLESASWTNPGIREFKQDQAADQEVAADTTDLVRIFREILDRLRNRPVIDIVDDSVTVGQMIQYLTRRLTMEDKPVALHRLLASSKSERSLIATFLALLELVRLQAIVLRQERVFGEIFIKKNTGFESVVNEGLTMQDDWK